MASTSCPTSIVQGTTHTWDVTESDYPSSGWTLDYTFQSPRQRTTVAGVASGSGWTVTLTKAITEDWFPGVLGWQAFVTNNAGTVRHLLASGVITIIPDVAVDQSPPTDPRTHARKALEQYNELLTQAAFIKTLQPEQIEALERIRKQYEWDVKRQDDEEKLRAGGYPTRKIFTRFV